MTDDTCSNCGAVVVWVITELGRRIELDPDPVDDGTIVPVELDGHIRARVLTSDQLPAEEPAWQRHSNTCPESPQARARRARLAPRCTVCLNPMDPALARLEGWTTHPACDPAEGAATVRAVLAAAPALPDTQLQIPEAS